MFAWQLMSTAINFIEHANVRVPERVDRVLRLVFVTPDMHRIHHSSAPGESRSNFSNTFSWWDRLFGTYIDQPAAGHADMSFGVLGFEERKHQALPWMLVAAISPGARFSGCRGVSSRPAESSLISPRQ